MKKTLWVLLVLAESITASILGWPACRNALMIAMTRREVLGPNAYYFAGMLFGDAIKLAIPLLLIGHAVWIVRTRFGVGRRCGSTVNPSGVSN